MAAARTRKAAPAKPKTTTTPETEKVAHNAAQGADAPTADKVPNAVTVIRTGVTAGDVAESDLYLVAGEVVTEMRPGQRGTVIATKGHRIAPHVAALLAARP